MLIVEQNRQIRAKTSSAPTTTDLSAYAVIVPVTSGALADPEVDATLALDDNYTELVAGPASGTVNLVKSLLVNNRDTVSHEVVIEHSDGTTLAILWNGTIPSGETLSYTQSGWVLTSAAAAASGSVLASTNDGRISASSSGPLAETAAGTSVYFHRFVGDTIALYDGSSEWVEFTIPETAISVLTSTGTTSKPHDVFVYDSSGLTLELVAWTNDTTRATALVEQDGVQVKSGATARRYLGTVYINASDQVADTTLSRGLWSESHRVRYRDYSTDTTNSWTDAGAGTWSAINAGNAAWKHDFVIGRDTDAIEAETLVYSEVNYVTAIGLDSTTSPSSSSSHAVSGNTGGQVVCPTKYVESGSSIVGKHYVQGLETTLSGTITAYGDAGLAAGVKSSFVIHGSR